MFVDSITSSSLSDTKQKQIYNFVLDCRTVNKISSIPSLLILTGRDIAATFELLTCCNVLFVRLAALVSWCRPQNVHPPADLHHWTCLPVQPTKRALSCKCSPLNLQNNTHLRRLLQAATDVCSAMKLSDVRQLAQCSTRGAGEKRKSDIIKPARNLLVTLNSGQV